MNILGISAYYHDSAACLVRDGIIVSAAQQERFTRIKHDHAFPKDAIAYCLKEAGITAQELDYVAFYDKPLIKFERLLETYISYAPRGWASFLLGMRFHHFLNVNTGWVYYESDLEYFMPIMDVEI